MNPYWMKPSVGSGNNVAQLILSLLLDKSKKRPEVCNLYICFFDLKKAYDSVPRDALWPLLIRYGLPSKMVNIIRHLHSNMEASVRIKGTLSEPFKVDTGLKQGCVHVGSFPIQHVFQSGYA